MTTAVHLTLEDFLSRPDRDDEQREELIEGELIVSPGAKPSHAEIVDRLREQLAPLKQQGYVLKNDFSCILGNRSMPVPDLAAVRQDRWDKALKLDDWLNGSPELVVEVASPTNRKLHRKAEAYIEHGAEQVWIIYPTTQTVTVVTPECTAEARLGETIQFHGLQVSVKSIFPSC